MFFRLGVTLVLTSFFSLLQKMIGLPTISHFMESFLQLPTLRCCMLEILMVLTILALVPKIGRIFDGLVSSEHWASLDLLNDVVGACVEMPASLIISLWVLVSLSIATFPRPLPILLLLRLVPCAYLHGLHKILRFS